jgi:hypothetical protein
MSSLSRDRFVQSLACSGALAVLTAGLLFAAPRAAARRNGIETLPGPHAEFSRLSVQTTAAGWSVSGQLRLLPNPLRHSNPGRVVLQAVAPDGQTLAAADATIYRVVTADTTARLFGFREELPDGFPAGTVLRIQHLPAGP